MKQAARLIRMNPHSHYRGTVRQSRAGAVWTGRLKRAPLDIRLKPLHWERPRMVFVDSMSDLFHESVPDAWIIEVFAVMAAARQHTFQLLTKRSARMRQFVTMLCAHPEVMDAPAKNYGFSDRLVARNPLPNLWLGVSCENQVYANVRIPDLLATPAAIRFISAEPLLGSIDLRDIVGRLPWLPARQDHFDATHPNLLPRIDWVIVGGESGSNARACDLDHVLSILDQCRSAGIPAFCKQLGSRARLGSRFLHLNHTKGGDPSEWPAGYNVREMPTLENDD
jgi:protein gp37